MSGRYVEGVHSREPMTWRERLLGQALADVLIAAGVLNEDMFFTGPELLLAAEQFCEVKR